MRRKDHPLYSTWMNMVYRCRPGTRDAFYYADRGIKVCDRWLDFWAFVEDMPPKPGPEYELDRIDNDGDYEPGNVRWATRAEQLRNRRGKWWYKTECPRGHSFAEYGFKDSRGARSCRQCRREQNREWRARKAGMEPA